MPKIVQITMGTSDGRDRIYALLSDGTLWSIVVGLGEWTQIQPPPPAAKRQGKP